MLTSVVGRIKEAQDRKKSKIIIDFICQSLGFKSRQAFYKRKRRAAKNAKEEARVLELTKIVRHQQYRVGTGKLYDDIKPFLENEDIKMGRDKVHKCLKKNDLTIKPKKKYKTTTDSKHIFWKYKNRIKDLNLTRPEQVFVNDITYIRVRDQFAYLFLVTDAYSKKIMGWTINYTMKVKDATKAILMAHRNRRFKNEVFHHSDRGIQYCTPSYIKYIEKKGMIPSMTEDLHVYENAVAERVNGILKGEFDIDIAFASLKEARAVIDQSIHIYNNKRRHLSLHKLTPNFVHFNPGIKIKTYKRTKENMENS
ncbi:IS3 family transposase [uncultured Eudoraea sp.]|uniref:IS3 family transposase n=1 Tax=uncultured Eudoraea sp. TaxID=1035614 RepID=UPI002614A22B|nr:IS3 family transposase [uncultured Eudoraea sp.]